jgi:hypothetical protein
MEGSVGKGEVKSMTLVQFGKFAQAAKLLKKKVLDVGMVDRIFLRANMDRSEGAHVDGNGDGGGDECLKAGLACGCGCRA